MTGCLSVRLRISNAVLLNFNALRTAPFRYAGVLSTFLATVFFEGGSDAATQTFWGSVLDSVVSSMLAAVMLFPVQCVAAVCRAGTESMQQTR
jgi:hypothetical protein